jgi:hypothetical protein
LRYPVDVDMRTGDGKPSPYGQWRRHKRSAVADLRPPAEMGLGRRPHRSRHDHRLILFGGQSPGSPLGLAVQSGCHSLQWGRPACRTLPHRPLTRHHREPAAPLTARMTNHEVARWRFRPGLSSSTILVRAPEPSCYTRVAGQMQNDLREIQVLSIRHTGRETCGTKGVCV